MADNPICHKCKHYCSRFYVKKPMCGAPHLKVTDVVTGEKQKTSPCRVQRSGLRYRLGMNVCGPYGRYFETSD